MDSVEQYEPYETWKTAPAMLQKLIIIIHSFEDTVPIYYIFIFYGKLS